MFEQDLTPFLDMPGNVARHKHHTDSHGPNRACAQCRLQAFATGRVLEDLARRHNLSEAEALAQIGPGKRFSAAYNGLPDAAEGWVRHHVEGRPHRLEAWTTDRKGALQNALDRYEPATMPYPREIVVKTLGLLSRYRAEPRHWNVHEDATLHSAVARGIADLFEVQFNAGDVARVERFVRWLAEQQTRRWLATAIETHLDSNSASLNQAVGRVGVGPDDSANAESEIERVQDIHSVHHVEHPSLVVAAVWAVVSDRPCPVRRDQAFHAVARAAASIIQGHVPDASDAEVDALLAQMGERYLDELAEEVHIVASLELAQLETIENLRRAGVGIHDAQNALAELANNIARHEVPLELLGVKALAATRPSDETSSRWWEAQVRAIIAKVR